MKPPRKREVASRGMAKRTRQYDTAQIASALSMEMRLDVIDGNLRISTITPKATSAPDRLNIRILRRFDLRSISPASVFASVTRLLNCCLTETIQL